MPTPTGSRRERGSAVFGVTGWKNAGKTTLVERLVAEFVRRGWPSTRSSTPITTSTSISRARDSYRHRAAGATEVAVVGGQRYAIMREQEEPTLAEVLARLAPADLILIEGYKREPHRKIEVRAGGEPMAPRDPTIVAIAADEPPADAGSCRGSAATTSPASPTSSPACCPAASAFLRRRRRRRCSCRCWCWLC